MVQRTELCRCRSHTLKAPSAFRSQRAAANALTGSGEWQDEGNALKNYLEQLISVCLRSDGLLCNLLQCHF